MAHDVVKRAIGLPKGEIELEEVHKDEEGHVHYSFMKEEEENGKKVENHYVRAAGQCYKLEEGRGLTNLKSSWIDFSITKNVFTMILALGLIGFVFMRVANYYKNNQGKAPKGLTNMMEVFVTFIRDDVAKPSIGPKYEKYMPLLMSLFFFILVNNLLGLIPIFPGSSNVTGNISVTIVLALVVFIVTTVSGNKNYWQHIFWMPGVPTFVKVLMAPIEIASLFIKPFTLLIRLFANVTAGHVIILTLVSLIFIFGNAGKSLGGSIMGMAIAVPFVAFMNLLELLVAFLQAFIFTLLSALYIGAAVEEHHHDDSHAH
jgi:F-type H+-transporting ATPase subunit a